MAFLGWTHQIAFLEVVHMSTGKCFGADAMGINAINAIARSITGSVLAVSYGNLALDGPDGRDGEGWRRMEIYIDLLR